MYFQIKNTLKNNRNNTLKHHLRISDSRRKQERLKEIE
jgi:hypothetical protein